MKESRRINLTEEEMAELSEKLGVPVDSDMIITQEEAMAEFWDYEKDRWKTQEEYDEEIRRAVGDYDEDE